MGAERSGDHIHRPYFRSQFRLHRSVSNDRNNVHCTHDTFTRHLRLERHLMEFVLRRHGISTSVLLEVRARRSELIHTCVAEAELTTGPADDRLWAKTASGICV